jgi:hypothetical protein
MDAQRVWVVTAGLVAVYRPHPAAEAVTDAWEAYPTGTALAGWTDDHNDPRIILAADSTPAPDPAQVEAALEADGAVEEYDTCWCVFVPNGTPEHVEAIVGRLSAREIAGGDGTFWDCGDFRGYLFDDAASAQAAARAATAYAAEAVED